MIQPVIEEKDVEYGISTILVSGANLLDSDYTYRDCERRYEERGPLCL